MLKHAAIGKNVLEDKDFLVHYRTVGSKNGVRHYQNEDGSLTEEGRRHYGIGKYSNLSDSQIRDIIDKKKLENEYVSLQTNGMKKQAENKAELIKESLKTAGEVGKIGLTKFKYDSSAWARDDAKKANDRKEEIEAFNKGKPEDQKINYKTDADWAQAANNHKIFSDSADQAEILKTQAVPIVTEKIPNLVVSDKMFSKELRDKGSISRQEAEALGKDNLKSVINRLKLEKELDELINPPKPSKVERGREIMQTVGSFLGITSTAITIYATIKKLGEKGQIKQSAINPNGKYLAHYRTVGSKNGVRRYQNEDGSLTAEGYRHYDIDPNWGKGGGQQPQPTYRQQKQTVDLEGYKKRQNSQIKRENDDHNRAQDFKYSKQQAKLDRQNAKYESKLRIQEAREMAGINNKVDKQDAKLNRQEIKARHSQIRKDIASLVIGAAAITSLVFLGKGHLEKIKGLNELRVTQIKEDALTKRTKIQEKTKQKEKTLDYKKEVLKNKTEIHKDDNQTKVSLRGIKEANKTSRYNTHEEQKTKRTESRTDMFKTFSNDHKSNVENRQEEKTKRTRYKYSSKTKIEELRQNGETARGQQMVDMLINTNERDIKINESNNQKDIAINDSNNQKDIAINDSNNKVTINQQNNAAKIAIGTAQANAQAVNGQQILDAYIKGRDDEVDAEIKRDQAHQEALSKKEVERIRAKADAGVVEEKTSTRGSVTTYGNQNGAPVKEIKANVKITN